MLRGLTGLFAPIAEAGVDVMTEADAVVPQLMRQWRVPQRSVNCALWIKSAVATRRWSHSAPEISDAPILAHTLVLMRNDTGSIRSRQIERDNLVAPR